MKEVIVKDADLQKAAMEGMDAFLQVFVKGMYDAIGGELTTETMAELNADQLTLLAWDTLHQEVMDGGFVQLIHNGHTLWLKHREKIEKDCTDEEFMALFEQFPDFDDLDDQFVEYEEEWTEDIAHYVDDHLERFATIEE